MKPIRQLAFAATVAASALAMGSAPALAQKQQLKMSTIAPGSSMYLVMTTMATLVNKNVPDINITVDATGAATKHMVDVGRGRIDMSMTSGTVYALMKRGAAMYKKLKEAPQLAENLRLLFWFPLGGFHYTVYDNSGINSLMDIKGKRVFLGPPGGGQWNTARAFIKGMTGYEVNKDYSNVKASFSAAIQGFQDRQVDVYTIGCIDPCAQLQQLMATSKLRFLGAGSADDGYKNPKLAGFFKAPGRTMGMIKKDAYGPNQTNKSNVYTNDAVLGVTIRKGVSDETVYKMMKAFWPALENIRANAPWTSPVTLDYGTQDLGMPFHPGAAKYYKEIGKM